MRWRNGEEEGERKEHRAEELKGGARGGGWKRRRESRDGRWKRWSEVRRTAERSTRGEEDVEKVDEQAEAKEE